MSDSGNAIRALLIEDNPGDVRLIREMLRDSAGGGSAPVALSHADRLSTGLEQLHKALVDLHGGHVWVESAPGQGSTLRVTLPSAYPPG